ncbi:hypothetical protein [Microvirga aerophila]|uniref:hypothetical protein n=1 Tax=Microvirga aerophila TaxID=670291 RepID=UPI0013B37851|nr:hypothetical protein [Microvirga aerophila]
MRRRVCLTGGFWLLLHLRQHLDPIRKVVRALVQHVVLISWLDRLLSAKDDIVRDVDEEPAPGLSGHVQSAHHPFGKARSLAGRMIMNPDLVSDPDRHG